MTDDYASTWVRELYYGPALAPKHIDREEFSGEVRIIKPADPEKLAALHESRKERRTRRAKAGLTEINKSAWGKR